MIEYGDTQLRIIGDYDLTKSSQDLSYGNITCDFTDKDQSNLPERYQECRVIIDGKVKYVGYINGYTFKEMREKDLFREISFDILSPRALTTIRTVIATGTYELKTLINMIFEPLVNDDFVIQEVNITNRNVSVNYVCNTIEEAMSDLSNKYNIWWYIDENKKIYVKDVVLLLSEEPKHIYDDTHKINGLQYVKPTIQTDDYANVVNFTNVRIFQLSRQDFVDELNPLITTQNITISKENQVDFNYPVDISQKNILKSADANGLKELEYYGIQIKGKYSDNSTFEVYIKCDENNYTMSNNVGFDGDEETTKEFLLIRDSFFTNLITGFKYNGNKTISSITEINSDSALIWNVNKMYNDSAIAEKKDIISKTGIVEITVDMNEQWKTLPELYDIGSTYIDKTSLKLDGTIELLLDKNGFNVGDLIKINKMLIDGVYIITQIHEKHTNHTEYVVTCKNTNLTYNYLDLFRSPNEQENEDKVYQTIVTHYVEESIKESHEVIR